MKPEDDSEDYDDYTPSDVHVESACQGYMILPIRQLFDELEDYTLCRECLQQTPPLITSVVTEIFAFSWTARYWTSH